MKCGKHMHKLWTQCAIPNPVEALRAGASVVRLGPRPVLGCESGGSTTRTNHTVVGVPWEVLPHARCPSAAAGEEVT